MIIRKAREKDINAITELLEQVLMVHYNLRPDLLLPGTKKYSREQLAEIIGRENTPVFVAEEDGTVLGHCFCQVEEYNTPRDAVHKTLYIDDLCVHENARNRHVGSALYEYTKEYAKELGCYNITLHVWEGNEPAEAFYRRVGFKPYMTAMEVIL